MHELWADKLPWGVTPVDPRQCEYLTGWIEAGPYAGLYLHEIGREDIDWSGWAAYVVCADRLHQALDSLERDPEVTSEHYTQLRRWGQELLSGKPATREDWHAAREIFLSHLIELHVRPLEALRGVLGLLAVFAEPPSRFVQDREGVGQSAEGL